jgi:hypothetical protein
VMFAAPDRRLFDAAIRHRETRAGGARSEGVTLHTVYCPPHWRFSPKIGPSGLQLTEETRLRKALNGLARK